ncbi:SDR family NAD(P)-dependent oxidoreductase [Streptomyces sp. NBC_00243]|uniref:SDR family NAD(P)-dependent oxidoreductase n=1 Tax=Streptomyces sp. NBC_00243 TaxID=2975688 RepID=UPI002DDA3FB7|nr:SDR family NAD(P)-dependent oxidoreductase [Streptomyces sp. NBC_00243]WRZ22739.1 SDR family NAD(P)-dependent oxidoreductase [Streptomyces sp. NBC_00243]
MSRHEGRAEQSGAGQPPPSTPALVTGATSGLGRSLARALADRGWTVLVHGRDEGRCAEVVGELRAAGGTAYPYLADLSSLKEAAELGRRVAAEHPSLGLLVNNAGVGAGRDSRRREVSRDGYELRLAVNYLAPVVLTHALRSPLRAAGSAQVLNIGSIGQSPVDPDDVQFTRRYDGMEAYTRSKFALAAFTFTIAEEYAAEGIRVNCVHPANYMDTTMVTEAGVRPWSSVAEGTAAVLHAVDDGARGASGQYYNESRRAKAHRLAYSVDTQRRLASLTEALIAPAEGASGTGW